MLNYCKSICRYQWLIPCLLVLFCFTSFYALGSMYPPAHIGDKWYKAYIVRHIAAAVIMGLWFYWMSVRTPRLFGVVLLPYFVASWLYMPQGLVYGDLTVAMFESLLATDSEEAFAYLQNFPIYVWVLWVAYLLFFLGMAVVIRRKQKLNNNIATGRKIKFERGAIYLLAIAVAFLFFIKPAYRNFVHDESYAINKWLMPQKFSARLIYVPYMTYKDLQFSKEAQNEVPQWQIEKVSPVYQNYVVVLGESVRADYLPMYGYPLNTSPFLSRVNGIRLANYVAPAPSTIVSISRVLSLTDENGQPKYAYTLINLANMAGFDTFWLSNQGKMGRDDSAVAKIGIRAKQYVFTKLGDYNETVLSDEVLLPHFQNALDVQTENPKLIVLHLLGSHPGFCDRITKEPEMYLPSRNMSCYLESLIQTDHLLQQVDDMLRHKQQSYSVVYFSDHGLSSAIDGWNSMVVGTKYKQNYAVPFIRFSSDSTKQEVIYSRKSGFDALSGLAQWMGIRETQLSRKPDFFAEGENGPVYVFNQEKLVDFDTLADDPAQKP